MLYLRNFALRKRLFLRRNRRFASKNSNDVWREAFLFTGQGSQFVGMCGRFIKEPWLQSLFRRASSVIGFDLLKLCLEGPAEELQKTENCQLAVVMSSLAAEEWYHYHGDSHSITSVCAAAGFSVGEFAALVFAKAISLEDALRVIQIRARAMQNASEKYPSGMVTVKGLQGKAVQDLCEAAKNTTHSRDPVQMPVAMVANFLYPKGHVIAGTMDVVKYILQYGKEMYGAKDVKQLPVSGAFHTPLMSSAQPVLKEALDSIEICLPQIPVYSNVTGKPFNSVEEIKKLLVKQVVEPVQWKTLITNLIADQKPDMFYEVGPGRQLNTMLYHIDSKYKRYCKNISV